MPVGVVRPHYVDPFSPMLLSSPGNLAVTQEQRDLLKEILDISCSDTQFAQKAYTAITLVLTGVQVKVPTVTSLVPNTAEIGDPSFTLHVHGTNFKNTDKIIFAGVEEPTTYVSATELTTGVNMDVWLGPDALPVLVESSEGVQSTPMTFTFTDGSVQTASVQQKKYIEPSKEIKHTEVKK